MWHFPSMKICTDTKHVTVPGGTIYTQQWVPKSIQCAIPIVLLHDSLGSVGLWRDFPEQLATHLSRTVIAYDRLGFGQSSAREQIPSKHFIVEEADIYFPVVKQALAIERFTLLGHSVGGAMAVSIAAQDTDCVAVITESAQAFVEKITREGIQKAQKFFEQGGQMGRLEKWHGEKASWVLNAWTQTWLSPEFLAWSLLPQLKKVRCPLLALHGDQDEYGSIAFPETISQNTRGKSHMKIIQHCGHVPHKEQLPVVLNHIEEFLKKLQGHC